MKSKLHPSLVTLTGKYKEHHADYETGIFCYQVKCGERYHKHDNSYHKQITKLNFYAIHSRQCWHDFLWKKKNHTHS